LAEPLGSAEPRLKNTGVRYNDINDYCRELQMYTSKLIYNILLIISLNSLYPWYLYPSVTVFCFLGYSVTHVVQSAGKDLVIWCVLSQSTVNSDTVNNEGELYHENKVFLSTNTKCKYWNIKFNNQIWNCTNDETSV